MRHSLSQFAAVFRVRNPSGLPYVLIGGQAVNFWAETYLPHEPALADWLPFTSEDIDFCGGCDDARRIADQLGLHARLPPRVAMTALAGTVPFRIGDISTNIEVVRSVPGVPPGKLAAWSVTAERDGTAIRVLDPISLLVCKTDLALTVPQGSRRDVEHLRILMLCTRAFLRETLRGVTAGELPVRGWLGAVERVLKLAESRRGRQAMRKLDLDWGTALPQVEINACAEPWVARLRPGRLTEWRRKLAGGR